MPFKNKLRALYWAEISMRGTRDAATLLGDMVSPGKELSHCIYTGIVVNYARPFGANHGLPSIGNEFHKFTDSQLQKLHDLLLQVRNTIYAHKDFLKEGERSAAGSSLDELEKIELDISDSGESHWIIAGPNLPAEYLKNIVVLCDFQIARLHQASDAMLLHFCAGKAYKPGKYVMGENFP